MCLLCNPLSFTSTEMLADDPVNFSETAGWVLISCVWLFTLYQGYQKCNPNLFPLQSLNSNKNISK